MNAKNKNNINLARTKSQQRKKEASQPDITTWLPLADTFRTALMLYDRKKLKEVKLVLCQQERSMMDDSLNSKKHKISSQN